MPVFVVQSYLENPTENLPALDSAMESMDVCQKPFPGTWVVEGALAAHQIHTLLAPHLRERDGVIIVRAGQDASWQGVAPQAEPWMGENFRRAEWAAGPGGPNVG